jgi:hypothetical protein
MTDENDDDDFDIEDIRDQATQTGGIFGSMLGSAMGMQFSAVDTEPSPEVKLASRMMMAGNAIEEFVEYVEENDMDLDELDEQMMVEMDSDDRTVLYGFMSMNNGLVRLGELFEDDDDDNPFKVSDGDDPIY